MANYLLEVGTEELPADFITGAIAQWQTRIPQSLTENFLPFDGIQVFATPRRLAVLIEGLAEKQPDREEEIKGPPAQAAFREGQPTKAAEGFARKQGVEVADLEIRPTEKGDFVFVQKKTLAQSTPSLLPALALDWITKLEGRRFMRWGDGDLRFPRPICWLVSLWNDEILPLEIVNGSQTLRSDRQSAGHRVLHPGAIAITQATSYEAQLAEAAVIVSPEKRRDLILSQIQDTAQNLGGVAAIEADLLAEVVNLVEYPTAVAGQFNPDFLSLPQEVITTVMVTHQRYFAVREHDGKNAPLLPHFITIANGDPAKQGIIAAGNGRVIQARLEDGQFFYKADCDDHLESYLPELEKVTFQEELGTMRDKVDRIMGIAQQIAYQLGLPDGDRQVIESAALLCKADLVTQMVYEFPELQGIMGEKYARVSGESEAVATAIVEHYLPKGADDDLPQTIAGQVVAIADRLDTIVSIFGIGSLPTGSSDPFALRRAANGILNIIWAAHLNLNLGELLAGCAADFHSGHNEYESPLENLQEFFGQRLQSLLQDEFAIDYDLVNGVIATEDRESLHRALADVLDLKVRAQFLQQLRQDGRLDAIYATINRASRLAVKGSLDTQTLDPTGCINPDLFEQESENALYQGLLQLVPQTQQAQGDRNYQLLVDALAAVAPTVTRFFDGEDSVLVMAEDEKVKTNRMNLLGLLRNHGRVLADFGAIVKG